MRLDVLNRRETMLGLTTAMGLKAFAPGSDRRLRYPSPSAEAKALYGFLWGIYGVHTLTGQQEQNFTSAGPGQELAYLKRVTGRQPALLGFDYIHPDENAAVNERAIAWARSGGIVSICWHWGAPGGPPGYEASKADFDLEAGLTPGTPENKAMLRDMDVVADLLKGLRDAGVPVLWRPLHEFSGQWFWWGRHGAEGFKALWLLMQDRFTQLHRLDNLIWVLGWAGQNVDPAFYPGRAHVDIVGADIYVEDDGNLAPMFAQVKAIVGNSVPICLHENGPVPDPSRLGPDADWLWFMTWHTEWLESDTLNPPDRLRRAYASDRYLTHDQLPIDFLTRRRLEAPFYPSARRNS
ncbi:glycosyl hydrolase [Brevundimonas vesicularis]|uniref:glycosyl hydrolase n=1 Tax=Brevundimonas vesicularis TaxID=41276 RepID=UPI00384EF1A7